MKDKICMITGANSGIGKAITQELAKLGAYVLMVCRDKEKGEYTQKEIINSTGNQNIDLFIADLSVQQEIRELVDNFKSKYHNLHVLINNAGLVLSKRILSADNIEMNLAVNHLAPFLLTNLLLEELKNSQPSRIINISSGIHFMAKLDVEDIQNEKKYRSFNAYGHSKLAMMLFTYKLSRRLEGTEVTCNAVSPGMVKTNLGRDQNFLSRTIFKLMAKSPKKGAETPIYLATSKEVNGITGKYFQGMKEIKSSEESYNTENAIKIWEISEKLTKLK